VVLALEEARFPVDGIIISSFEGPRLCNFRTLGSAYKQMKLVGAERFGVEGIIKASQMWLGPTSAVAVPLGFATAANVRELRSKKGIRVEVGMRGVGACFQEKDSKWASSHPADLSALLRAVQSGVDYICGDHPTVLKGIMPHPKNPQ